MANPFDRALTEAINKTYTRRSLLKGTIAASASALVLSAFSNTVFPTREAEAAGPLDSDLDILNYALTLELLEADAYRTVNSMNVLTGRAKTYFADFGMHEQAHVDAVTATIKQLGGTPVTKPAGGYNYASVPKSEGDIVAFFQTIEAVGASAYLGAAGSIKNLDVLAAALSIHASEAEHTAALADIVKPGSDLFAPESFATPRTPAQVVTLVAPFFPAGVMPSSMPQTGGGFAASQVGGGPDLVIR